MRSEAEAGRAQYEAQLPLLAVGSAELRGYAGALKEGLRDSAPLLRRDVGRLLQQVGVKDRCGPGCVNMCVLFGDGEEYVWILCGENVWMIAVSDEQVYVG